MAYIRFMRKISNKGQLKGKIYGKNGTQGEFPLEIMKKTMNGRNKTKHFII